jgi:hypothetical protein
MDKIARIIFNTSANSVHVGCKPSYLNAFKYAVYTKMAWSPMNWCFVLKRIEYGIISSQSVLESSGWGVTVQHDMPMTWPSRWDEGTFAKVETWWNSCWRVSGLDCWLTKFFSRQNFEIRQNFYFKKFFSDEKIFFNIKNFDLLKFFFSQKKFSFTFFFFMKKKIFIDRKNFFVLKKNCKQNFFVPKKIFNNKNIFLKKIFVQLLKFFWKIFFVVQKKFLK